MSKLVPIHDRKLPLLDKRQPKLGICAVHACWCNVHETGMCALSAEMSKGAVPSASHLIDNPSFHVDDRMKM
jgi:hypothetical protein